MVQIQKGRPAIFFTVVSGGVGGHRVHLTLLRPAATGADLENWIDVVPRVTNFGQYEFRTEPKLWNTT